MGWGVPRRQAVGAAGTVKGTAGNTEGRTGGKNGSTNRPDGGGGTTSNATSAAPRQAKVSDNSGAGIEKGIFRPVHRRRFKWRQTVLLSHNTNQERRPALCRSHPSS